MNGTGDAKQVKPSSKKLNIFCSCSFVEPRPKMMIMITMGHDCVWGVFLGKISEREKGKRKGH
jgi:hypothetical protein